MLAVDKKISFDAFSMGKRPGEAEPEYTTIGMTVAARDALAAYCRDLHGANVREVASVLVEWFLRQKKPVRTAILSGTDEGMEHAYAYMLMRLAVELVALDVGIGGEHGANAKQSDPAQGQPETPEEKGRTPGTPLAEEGQDGPRGKRRR
jgi:hypothetical protein